MGLWVNLKMGVLDREIATEIKLGLWNAAINSILKYSMTTIDKTQSTDEEMQKFASTCLRNIILWKYGQEQENQKIRNYAIRKDNMPTSRSQILRGNLSDISRWGTSLSHAYLNNVGKFDKVVIRLGIPWGGMNLIMREIKPRIHTWRRERNCRNSQEASKKEKWGSAKTKTCGGAK